MYPFRRKESSKFRQWARRKTHVILLIWLIGIAISAPEYLMFSAEPFCFNKQLYFDCRKVWPDSISDPYTVFIYVCTFALPLMVISYLYTSIGLKLWRRQMPGNVDVNRDLTMQTMRVKVIKMLFVVVVLFAVSWLPLQTFSMIMFLYPDIRKGFQYQSMAYNIFIGTYFACHWLSMAHSCLNPLIYCFMNEKFRSDLHDLICKRRYYSNKSMFSSQQQHQQNYHQQHLQEQQNSCCTQQHSHSLQLSHAGTTTQQTIVCRTHQHQLNLAPSNSTATSSTRRKSGHLISLARATFNENNVINSNSNGSSNSNSNNNNNSNSNGTLQMRQISSCNGRPATAVARQQRCHVYSPPNNCSHSSDRGQHHQFKLDSRTVTIIDSTGGLPDGRGNGQQPIRSSATNPRGGRDDELAANGEQDEEEQLERLPGTTNV